MNIPPPIKAKVVDPGLDAPDPALGPSWRPSWLLEAPHRLAFFFAALMLATSSIWWGAVLISRSLGLTPEFAIPVSTAHALLMSMGFMPLFFAGFLFTAGPKWLSVKSFSARKLLPALSLMLAGWVITLPGIHFHSWLAAAGIAMLASGWTWLTLKFVALVRQSRLSDRVHPTLAAFSCGVGVLTLWLLVAALALESDMFMRSAIQIGIWWFLGPVFAVVSHRMIPFFSASAVPLLDAWRPMWLLWVMLASLWIEGGFHITEVWWWALPGSVRWLQAVFEFPVALLMLWLAIRWGLVQSLRIRMLAMLHGGFVWLGLAFALSAVSSALMALSANAQSLGLAPMHAMTMGYLGATMFAMTTRVSSGHGGRSLAADNLAWGLYWVLQTAVLLRVVAAIWLPLATSFTLLAIAAWAIATIGWAIRYGRWFGRPRSDGRPG